MKVEMSLNKRTHQPTNQPTNQPKPYGEFNPF